jgi:hypothetical protein
MKDRKHIIVTKRDGTLERFRPAKLVATVARAMRARRYDPALAEPLVRAVALHLREWGDPQPPTTNYIHRCVCSVLRQTGLSDIGDDLAAARRQRTLCRRRVRVVERDGDPRGETWRKAVVVETLQNTYGLRYAVCRFLAGQIEQQIFALNYRRVKKSFLAELVRNEVMAWGLADEQVLKAGARVAGGPHVVSQPPEQEN